MILYLSGPMTGYENFNFPAFDNAAWHLREMGYHVLNPAENWGGKTDVPRELCMRLDIQQVLAADGLAMLDGWHASAGAKLESTIAAELGLDIKPWKEWLTC